MWVIPKGVAYLEGLDVSESEPPRLLAQLRAEKLTGYARLHFLESQAFFLLVEGRLVDVVCEREGKRLVDLAAIARAFELACSESGRVDVYRVAPDLAEALHGLFHGEALFEGQNLSLLDVKSLLANIKSRRLTGALRVYTRERSGLIFFRDGTPLGFFHDGSQQLDTAATEYQKIASLPGAMIDGYASADAAPTLDLFDLVDLERLWRVTRTNHAGRLEQTAEKAREEDRRRHAQRITELDRELRGVLTTHLGPKAGEVLDRLLSQRGGLGSLADPGESGNFLVALEKAAKLLAGGSRAEKVKAAAEKLLRQLLPTLADEPPTAVS